ncbi:hypothetical protein [Yoonia sp.]|uniref:hypothetical protein n=1 Tax=Yoonia sp. TaxID=2212373 RepID=UPI00391C57C2
MVLDAASLEYATRLNMVGSPVALPQSWTIGLLILLCPDWSWINQGLCVMIVPARPTGDVKQCR